MTIRGRANEEGPPARTLRGWLGLWLRGAAMGVAELVPGVSGGTIAFITGIYLELVETIRAYDHRLLRLVLAGRFRAAWERGNVPFVLVLIFGMAVSLVLLASLVQWLLIYHEIYLWAFFFGLITASVVFLAGIVTPWDSLRIGLGVLGLVLGALLSQLGGMAAGEGTLVTLAAGAIAICAWVLPGISGSFMLLMLGQYQRMVRALAELDFAFLIVFGFGCALGLLAFARLLSWLMRNFYAATLALLCGVMAGSLQRLWPWQQIQSYQLGSDGTAVMLRGRPLLPWQFEEFYGDDALLVGAVLAALAGMAVVLVLDRVSRR